MCESWNADDEAALAAMIARKNEVMGKRRTVLLAVVEKLNLDLAAYEFDSDLLECVTDELITHADAITSALKAFTRKEVGNTKLTSLLGHGEEVLTKNNDEEQVES
jgi:hypothetical protein